MEIIHIYWHEENCFWSRDSNASTIVGWISMTFGTDSRGPKRTNHNNGGPLTLHLTPPAGQSFHSAGWNISTFPTLDWHEIQKWIPRVWVLWTLMIPWPFLFQATSALTFLDLSEMSGLLFEGLPWHVWLTPKSHSERIATTSVNRRPPAASLPQNVISHPNWWRSRQPSAVFCILVRVNTPSKCWTRYFTC